MKWAIIACVLAFYFTPVQAYSRVSGYSFEITSVDVAVNGYIIYWDQHKRLLVFDTAHCGPPPPETAYRQIVETTSGRTYETVFVGGCAYSAG